MGRKESAAMSGVDAGDLLRLDRRDDSAVTRSGNLPYAQGFAPLSLPTTRPHISPRVISDLDAQSITRIPTVHAHDDTLVLNIPITMEAADERTTTGPTSPLRAGISNMVNETSYTIEERMTGVLC